MGQLPQNTGHLAVDFYFSDGRYCRQCHEWCKFVRICQVQIRVKEDVVGSFQFYRSTSFQISKSFYIVITFAILANY